MTLLIMTILIMTLLIMTILIMTLLIMKILKMTLLIMKILKTLNMGDSNYNCFLLMGENLKDVWAKFSTLS
jgi:hypothetical protein